MPHSSGFARLASHRFAPACSRLFQRAGNAHTKNGTRSVRCTLFPPDTLGAHLIVLMDVLSEFSAGQDRLRAYSGMAEWGPMNGSARVFSMYFQGKPLP